MSGSRKPKSCHLGVREKATEVLQRLELIAGVSEASLEQLHRSVVQVVSAGDHAKRGRANLLTGQYRAGQGEAGETRSGNGHH